MWLCNHISIQPLALCIFWCGAHTHTWNGNKKKTVNETRNQSKKFYRRWNLCGAMKNICFFLSLFEYIMCLAECWTICYSEWSSYIQLISELSQFKALKRRKIERHRARERDSEYSSLTRETRWQCLCLNKRYRRCFGVKWRWTAQSDTEHFLQPIYFLYKLHYSISATSFAYIEQWNI